MNYNELCLLFIRELRGDIPQVKISKQLGYSGNQYYKFEAGIKKFYLNDLIDVCSIIGPDLNTIFSKIFGIKVSEGDCIKFQKDFLSIFLPSNNEVIAEVLNCSKSRVWRLRNGKSYLEINDLFIVMDKYAAKLQNFLAEFGSVKVYESKVKGFSTTKPEILFQKYPEAMLFTTVIYLFPVIKAPFREKRKIMQSYLGISVERFDEIFDYMLNHKFISIENDQYVSNREKSEFKLAGNDQLIMDLIWKNLLNKVFHRSVEEKKYISRKSFKIAPVTKSAKKQIIFECKEFYKRLTDIVDEDNPTGRDEILYYGHFLFSHNAEDDA